MMLRVAIEWLLLLFVARALWRVIDGFREGLSGKVRTGAGRRSVPMVRDPVCGTYVVPDRAIILTDGPRRVYLCSARCRETYRARTA